MKNVRVKITTGKMSPTTGAVRLLFVLIITFGTILLKEQTIDVFIAAHMSQEVSAQVMSDTVDLHPIESDFDVLSRENVAGITKVPESSPVKTNVQYVDLRVQVLKEVFAQYNSPLEANASDFIHYADLYGVKNWQLIPAIGLAETRGCTTGTTYSQRNCWGWGGADPTRVLFPDFTTAIDTITARMISAYGEDKLNAKDIQSTYCGKTCDEWGWRWAKGVNYFVQRINDVGEKYNLERTNEIDNWDDFDDAE